MKHVQVFQLREPTIMAIPESSREIQYHSMDPRPVRLVGDEQPYAIPMVETVTCPVHCLKHAVKGGAFFGVAMDEEFIKREYGPGYVHDPEQGVWVKTQYIAMEPELFKMLDAVIRQPYEERERLHAARMENAIHRREAAENTLNELRRRVDDFWALPWYKRVWFAITKDC